MYTQCPVCKTAYRITTDEVRVGQGKVLCSHCNSVFDAISSLADVAFEYHLSDIRRIPELTIENSVSPPSETDALVKLGGPESAESVKLRLFWGSASVFLLFLLLGQAVYFQSSKWAQNEEYRPWLEKFCRELGCVLPEYHHPDDIVVIERALEPAGRGALQLRVLIINNGLRPVALPRLDLKLIQFNGDPLAQRVFGPKEYLNDLNKVKDLPVGRPIQINLKIANPDNEIAGYSFKFI